VKTINPHGTAAMDGRIGISDRIVAVNGVNLTAATRQEVCNTRWGWGNSRRSLDHNK